MGKVKTLKQILEYEKVGYLDVDFTEMQYATHGSTVPFVRTKHRGYDRFYCLFPRKRGDLEYYQVYRIGNYRGNAYFLSVTDKQEAKIKRTYFQEYLMEELL